MAGVKPVGIFSVDPAIQTCPPWAQFALLADWCDFAEAVRMSREMGVWWVLGIFSYAPDEPLAGVLPALIARIDAAGLRPYLVGVCYHEEWYGRFKGGAFDTLTTEPGMHLTEAGQWKGAELIHQWVGQQHAAIKAALPGVPIAWIDGYVNDDRAHGAWWYQPVPDHVDVLALEGYVPAGGTWAANVEPFLRHAVATRREPIVLIVQGFHAPGDALWGDGPTEDGLTGTARWMAHPRVVSAWIFDWHSRPGMRGLDVLVMQPRLLAAVGV